MLYLFEELLNSREAVAAVWIYGVAVAVILGCLCVALFAALFHPDRKTKESAQDIVQMLLGFLSKGSRR